MDTSFFNAELIVYFEIIILKKGIDLSYLDKNIMKILNVIMDILIGAAFIMNVCFKEYFKIYAYGILPAIFLVSDNIYSSIKNKDYKSYRLFYSIFWILIILILLLNL